MSSVRPEHPRNAPVGEPVWGIAELFPEQGRWAEEQYLALKTRRLVEFDNGKIEFLPMPSKTHQLIALLLYELLKAFVTASAASRGWLVLVAPYKIRIPTGRFREPDVLYLTQEQNAESNEDFAISATIAMEVVSPDEPNRDYVEKRADYAAAGVPEYWIVDRHRRQILILRLEDGAYVEHGTLGPGQTAVSSVLRGFTVPVDAVLEVGTR